MSGSFTDVELESMTVAPWERAKRAVTEGRLDDALARIDEAAARTRGLQVYSIEWITSLLSFVGRELGEDAVERALRVSTDDFIRARRQPEGAPPWGSLPATARAKTIARAMVANGGDCAVTEDDEKVVLSFRCGSGGRLIDERRYDEDGGPFLTLRDAGPTTFQRASLPVYCAHCSVHNEIQPVEEGGVPTSIEYPPEAAGEPCVHHVYKNVDAVPDAAYARIGVTRPGRPPSDA
ncbi:MAG TPA: hypothetical protein VGZ52_06025 [Acidimicrobiales bacterium]|nr:hypothetical protein [Acidimicrobiales bacterium]